MKQGSDYIGSYNPNDSHTVETIKAKSADLIDFIMKTCPDNRRNAIAFTHIEEAAMMAVKSYFSEVTK